MNDVMKNKMRVTLALLSCVVLTGCSGMLDSMNASVLNVPDDAPAGYATYLKAQQEANNRNFSMARFHFCNAAELGYEQAKSECSKYSVIDAGVSSSTKQGATKSIASSVRMKVCDAAQYGDPAKSLCEKIQSAGDETTIELVVIEKK